MASGGDPLTFGELTGSAAAPNTTSTSTAVINISTATALPGQYCYLCTAIELQIAG